MGRYNNYWTLKVGDITTKKGKCNNHWALIIG